MWTVERKNNRVKYIKHQASFCMWNISTFEGFLYIFFNNTWMNFFLLLVLHMEVGLQLLCHPSCSTKKKKSINVPREWDVFLWSVCSIGNPSWPCKVQYLDWDLIPSSSWWTPSVLSVSLVEEMDCTFVVVKNIILRLLFSGKYFPSFCYYYYCSAKKENRRFISEYVFPFCHHPIFFGEANWIVDAKCSFFVFGCCDNTTSEQFQMWKLYPCVGKSFDQCHLFVNSYLGSCSFWIVCEFIFVLCTQEKVWKR